MIEIIQLSTGYNYILPDDLTAILNISSEDEQ